MTVQKSLKRRVRARMSKTGERYAAARHQLLAKELADAPPSGTLPSDAPLAEPPAVPDEPSTAASFRGDRATSDLVIASRTGRSWSEWFALLDAWGAADRPHPEIARWLNAEHGVSGWWAQELTVGYEIAIGRRRPGQRPDGYEISVSKTFAAPVERLFEAFVGEAERTRWLPGVSMKVRTATPYRTARFDWGDGATRVAVGFRAKADSRSSIALAHHRFKDAETAERQRSLWRERLGALQRLLES